MELTGLQIFKYLPGAKKSEGSNCKKCGCPTCMAFAMKLAKKQVDIDQCEYVTDELKNLFLDSIKVKQHEITMGSHNELKTGNESVMFRHDKTFVNRTVIAVTLYSNDYNFENKLKKIKKYSIDRIGESFTVDAINLVDNGGIVSALNKVIEYGFPFILDTNDEKIIENVKKYNPLIVSNSDNSQNTVVYGKTPDEIGNLSSKMIKNGYKKLVLELCTNDKSTKQIIDELTYIRKQAVIEKNMPFTFPVMVKVPKMPIAKVCAISSLLICKYANIIVLEDFNEALLSVLYTLRQNIYTNPQKPLQVESKIYEFNEPDANSPIMLTTNFALTYFAVANELESMPFGSYLIVTPSDGMSVLTAWSADKFTAEIVAKTIKNSDLNEKVNNKEIIIPGLLSHMKEELEEALPDWSFIVGTIEAFQLTDFIKNRIKS